MERVPTSAPQTALSHLREWQRSTAQPPLSLAVPARDVLLPGARTPRVSGGALRASAAEIVHTEIVHTYMHMHMMNSGRSRDPPPYHPW